MRPIKSGKEEEDKLEQHFREQLRNMQVTPPAAMWDKVEAGLDEQRDKIKYDHWYYALLILLLPFTITSVVVNYNIKGIYKEFLTEKKRTESFGPRYNLISSFPSQLRHLDKVYERTISQPLDMNYVEDIPYEAARYANSKMGKQHTSSSYLASLSPEKGNGFENNAASINNNQDLFQHSRFGMNNGLAYGNEDENGYLNCKIELDTKHLTEVDNDNNIDLPAYNKRYYKRAARRNSPLSLPNIIGLYIGVDGAATRENVFLRYSHNPILSKDADFNTQWGYSYGIKAGYNFSRHFGLETEWIIRSVQGSKYYYLYGGKIPVTGNIHLTYVQVPVVAKYKFSKVSRLTGQPVSFNILGGIMYNRLNEVVMNTNETHVVNTSQFFASNQLGLTAGIEYDLFVNKYFFFTFGGRGSIYTDVTKPGGKPNSYGTMLGINAGLNFQFPEWKKRSDKTVITTEP